jgi:hypothetical protein
MECDIYQFAAIELAYKLLQWMLNYISGVATGDRIREFWQGHHW